MVGHGLTLVFFYPKYPTSTPLAVLHVLYTVGLRSVVREQWRGVVGVAKINLMAIELPV